MQQVMGRNTVLRHMIFTAFGAISAYCGSIDPRDVFTATHHCRRVGSCIDLRISVGLAPIKASDGRARIFDCFLFDLFFTTGGIHCSKFLNPAANICVLCRHGI